MPNPKHHQNRSPTTFQPVYLECSTALTSKLKTLNSATYNPPTDAQVWQERAFHVGKLVYVHIPPVSTSVANKTAVEEYSHLAPSDPIASPDNISHRNHQLVRDREHDVLGLCSVSVQKYATARRDWWRWRKGLSSNTRTGNSTKAYKQLEKGAD